MTLIQLRDYMHDKFFVHYGQERPGLDRTFLLELDEQGWLEFQQDIKQASDGNYFKSNGELVTEAEFDAIVFDKIRMPYLGEFEIVKSDKFSLTLKED